MDPLSGCPIARAPSVVAIRSARAAVSARGSFAAVFAVAQEYFMLSKMSCPQLALAPLVATPQVTPAVMKSLIGGNPVPQKSRVGESNRTAVPLVASNSISRAETSEQATA